ncbi:MAG: hypothetical protein ACJ8AD_12730 [Gemmatimonadaceae bacterium]
MHRARTPVHVIAAWLLASALAMSCREPTAPLGELAVTGAAAIVIATRAPYGFTVDVTLRNPSPTTLRLGYDGPTAERETATDQWEPVPAPYSDLMTRPDVDLPPMSELSAHAAISLPPGLFPSGGKLAGRYRLVYGYWTVGVFGELQLARSAPFEVVEP